MPTNEFQLIPGTLPGDPACYPPDPQTLYNQFFSLGRVVSVNGGQFYNLSPLASVPTADRRDYPWFVSDRGYWAFWISSAGVWGRPHTVPASSDYRAMWVGNTTDLATFDGGSVGAVSDATGAMWEVDTDFDAKVPIGPGTLPSTAVIPVGGTGGNETITQTVAQLASHRHDIINKVSAIDQNGAGQRCFNQGGLPQAQPDITTQTDYAGGDASDVTQPMNIMPPYRGIYIIKRTSRIYIRVA